MAIHLRRPQQEQGRSLGRIPLQFILGDTTVCDTDGLGSIQIDGQTLGAAKASGKLNTWVAELGAGSGVYVGMSVYDDARSSTGKRLVIVKGSDIANTITINNFNLTNALEPAGYLGLKLDPARRLAVKEGAGANLWGDPTFAAASLSAGSSSIIEGGAKTYTVYFDRAALAGDTVTLSLSGLGDKFQAILGNTTVAANGAVITLVPGPDRGAVCAGAGGRGGCEWQRLQRRALGAARMSLRSVRWLIAGLAMTLLTACSKTVSWEEEVPLNTGEVIWVKRIVTYKLEGASGNPLDIAHRPDWTETLEFMWDGKAYSYTGDADIMLLAISPTARTPVLVARADLKNWDYRNSYRCTTPFYVQFLPDESGRRWNWPPAIESWLFEMPYNLMYYRPSVDGAKSKYIIEDRFEKDQATRSQSPSLVRIDPNDTFDQCRK